MRLFRLLGIRWYRYVYSWWEGSFYRHKNNVVFPGPLSWYRRSSRSLSCCSVGTWLAAASCWFWSPIFLNIKWVRQEVHTRPLPEDIKKDILTKSCMYLKSGDSLQWTTCSRPKVFRHALCQTYATHTQWK